MPYSNCCGAFTNMEELGICPDCKDHCEFEEECDCDGGLVIVIESEAVCCGNFLEPFVCCNNPDAKQIQVQATCPKCEGTGMKTIEA